MESRLLPQILKHNIPNQRRDIGNQEIPQSEYVMERNGQRLPPLIRRVELSHQQVGIEQKDNEANLDHSTHECTVRLMNFRHSVHTPILQSLTRSGAPCSRQLHRR